MIFPRCIIFHLNLLFFLYHSHKDDGEQRFSDLESMAELSLSSRKKSKNKFDKNKNGKMLREMEDNCVTRQEVLVQNLNEFKGQFNVELFSKYFFLLSPPCVPVSNNVSVFHFFVLFC